MHTVIEMGLVMLVGQPERPPPPTPEFEVIARHDVSVHEFKRQPNHPAAIQQTVGRVCFLFSGIGVRVPCRPPTMIIRCRVARMRARAQKNTTPTLQGSPPPRHKSIR